MRKRSIRFHVGGPCFHPVAEQARMISRWLGDDFACSFREGHAAFEGLDDCDLFVPMGLFWTGSDDMPYVSLGEKEKTAFERYVAAGKPLVVHHGSIASYDDWPEFGKLLGFSWIWGTTTHSPFGTYTCRVLATDHPVTAGVSDYTIEDEIYYKIRITPGLAPEIHAVVPWDGKDRPMILSAQGAAGRVRGAGKVVYLANGHDMRSFQCPALRQIWLNSIHWALKD